MEENIGVTAKKKNSLFKVVKTFDEWDTVVINGGTEKNIEKGFRFLIFEVGEEIFDPDTNESLGRLEIIKGTGKVTHVQDKIATITSDMIEKESKTIIRKQTPFTSFWQTEEVVSNGSETALFNEPKVGDFAKYIP